ncbi:MAG TPA: hypothetical protein PK184_07850 [Phycisphaerae bacterium]|jgi:hypothetical protein|nr:hypothetical protein [Phycisphaerae bacterium]HPU32594.1 hypothetical protein [Phycisphaerae bacterium]HQE45307.1 hypothetical protein [Phycisphaerae bacterium]HXK85543.1 hypothetical protein [Phycisphaerae bacterium]
MSPTSPFRGLFIGEEDHQTPRRNVIEQIQTLIASGWEVVLGVGLTRPFRKSEDSDAKHWLQVNNVFVRANLLWSWITARDGPAGKIAIGVPRLLSRGPGCSTCRPHCSRAVAHTVRRAAAHTV